MYTLITGASTGIGKELARVAAEQKQNLILVARSKDKLIELQQELLAKAVLVEIFICDLSHHESAAQVFQFCEKNKFQVGRLINNAGFGLMGQFYELSLLKQQEMVNLNISSLMQLTHFFLPAMISRKNGKIMNVASTAAFAPGPLMAVYYASKAFVLSFSEALSKELEDTGVSVTALCPGPTMSEFKKTAGIKESILFNTLKLPSSLEVAHYGFAAMENGQVVAVHGLMNRAMARGASLLPKSVLRNMVLKLQKNRQS